MAGGIKLITVDNVLDIVTHRRNVRKFRKHTKTWSIDSNQMETTEHDYLFLSTILNISPQAERETSMRV